MEKKPPPPKIGQRGDVFFFPPPKNYPTNFRRLRRAILSSIKIFGACGGPFYLVQKTSARAAGHFIHHKKPARVAGHFI